jgi:hypothetical protein
VEMTKLKRILCFSWGLEIEWRIKLGKCLQFLSEEIKSLYWNWWFCSNYWGKCFLWQWFVNWYYFFMTICLREIRGIEKCVSLCRIEIPSLVVVIGWFGFSGCTSLKEIVFFIGQSFGHTWWVRWMQISLSNWNSFISWKDRRVWFLRMHVTEWNHFFIR